jgi:hypothetical protein
MTFFNKIGHKRSSTAGHDSLESGHSKMSLFECRYLHGALLRQVHPTQKRLIPRVSLARDIDAPGRKGSDPLYLPGKMIFSKYSIGSGP